MIYSPEPVRALLEKLSARTPGHGRETIRVSELRHLAFCNADTLPHTVEHDGKRKHWVGIGWVDEGKPKGTEVLVIDDEGED